MIREIERDDWIYKLYCVCSILLLLYCSGNYFVMSNYSTSVVIFLTFQIISLFIIKNSNTITKSIQIFFMVTAMVFLLSLLTNTLQDYRSYLAIFMQMIGAVIISIQIREEEFENWYTRIMLLLAVISLVFYTISMIYPSIAYKFPRIDRDDLYLRYYNAYVYVFWEETGWGHLFLSKRNAGIFWEPGVYQAFLNYALFLVLNRDNQQNKFMKAAILIITIITTISATGFIVLSLILFLFVMKNKHSPILRFLLVIGAILLIMFGLKNSLIINKISDTEYLSDRISLPQLQLLFLGFRSYICGYTFTGRNALISTTWNSIIDSCFVFGIPYVLYLITKYYRYSIRMENGILLFICLLMFFSTESLIWRPFFLLLLFYSMMPLKLSEEINKV